MSNTSKLIVALSFLFFGLTNFTLHSVDFMSFTKSETPFESVKTTKTESHLVTESNEAVVCEMWYIPLDIDASNQPMVFVCPGDQPSGYFQATNQSCAETLADSDPFCVSNDWDNLCQENYNECIFDVNCTGLSGDWYIPNTIGAGPMVYACTQPTNYTLAEQDCAQQIASNDSFCTSANFDGICIRSYNCCLGLEGCNDSEACNYEPFLCPNEDLCIYPSIYIPIVAGAGSAVISCERPIDYQLAENQDCAQQILDSDSFCSDSNWDNICNTDYLCCIASGCTSASACNYDEDACTNDGSCVFGGCTYVDAINYDSSAGCDDGSCVFPSDNPCTLLGCTYPDATNFNSSANCDDGSCMFNNLGDGGCAEDINSDGLFDGADLLFLLGVFGGACDL